MFSFQVETVLQSQITKRILISRVSKLFDPLGVFITFCFASKIHLQEIWIKDAPAEIGVIVVYVMNT